ncbi:hypothetical protein San01_58980 [Streptomyces angustmyceticus]|uniref:Uncharacterized protein n=1 Tax=Streptomyces angustmyceticus TaxID=285578 RepID=A0A5J4LP85_9ACTN|nr:hypothetical protein San01_58980 [Streptomyces angustmyceticus]
MAADDEWAVTLIGKRGRTPRVERFASRRTVCAGRRLPARYAVVAPGHAGGPRS